MLKKLLVLSSQLLVVLCLFFLLPTTNYSLLTIHAQYQGIEVNPVFQIGDPQAIDGDILSLTNQGIVRSSFVSDNNIFGVLQNEPLAAFRDVGETGKAVVRNGTAIVRVSAAAGPIKAGDYITSSTTPGIGQKALQSGYVLGQALGDFSGPDVGQIPVALKIEYAEIDSSRNINRLLQYLNAAIFKDLQSPDQINQILKYLLAAIVVITSFLIGFITFSRSIPKSIESIGRNPLAKNAIYLSIALSIGLTLVTTVVGIVAAIIILKT